MGFDPAYLSHLPILSAAVSITQGPVLELGAGLGSTLLLHGLCGASKRKLVTLESDKEWLGKFLNFGRSWHEFRFVEDFLDIPEYKKEWGLVFIDHGIALQRGISLKKLENSSVIVCHDTCHFFLYEYEPTLSNNFRSHWDYQIMGPRTTVVSNIFNVAKKFAEFGL